MIRPLSFALLLSATAISPAAAQETSEIAAEVRALRERVAELEARLAQAEAASTAAPTAPAPATPSAPSPQSSTSFRGAPTFTSGEWSFKPRGRLQFDAGWVEGPDGISDRGLGFATEVRRARLGAEGTMPGGFGYVFELDFAGEAVEIIDAILTWRASDRITLTAGQHNPFQSLEELTSSRFTSFLERAAFTDAFGFERRLGLSATYSKGPLIVQAGAFSDDLADLGNDDNNSAGADARIVFATVSGETKLHFGASAHYRNSGDLDDGGASIRYRQRPLLHTTDTRFVSTPALAVAAETGYGLEAALIRGPFHAAAEAHWLRPDSAGLAQDPTFFGAYVEAGWFVTGETRGYRNGRWDRTRVADPVGGGDGGPGALQINLRFDHLDLSSGTVRGGIQDSYLASLIWIPQDYVRFMLNAGHLRHRGSAVPAAGGDRSYGVNVIGARAQIDF
ncbi:OprO/OprP family phosphate-selective porin [Allosphingosinicella sp.]|jgi:phosphate-selective porin OprO/OprP|uniref:OprO/OprP family phosphate-selective porin n=1 Tax=Allosphingosinicella sp. TaxID=2823234 RepID=UPI002EFE6378